MTDEICLVADNRYVVVVEAGQAMFWGTNGGIACFSVGACLVLSWGCHLSKHSIADSDSVYRSILLCPRSSF